MAFHILAEVETAIQKEKHLNILLALTEPAAEALVTNLTEMSSAAQAA